MVFCLTFDYKTVGGRIKHYRLSINKTQEELAELADISADKTIEGAISEFHLQ